MNITVDLKLKNIFMTNIFKQINFYIQTFNYSFLSSIYFVFVIGKNI